MIIYGPGYGGEYECEVCGYIWTSKTKYQDPARCPRCNTRLTFNEKEKYFR